MAHSKVLSSTSFEPWTLPPLLSTTKWPHAALLAVIGIITYLSLVRLLRYRNLSKIQRLARPYRANLDAMPYDVAHAILTVTLCYEAPVPYHISMQRALLKSYMANEGEGTQLLAATRQLLDPGTAARRIEDTGLLLAEILLHGVGSARGAAALARVNWLHRRYASRITNTGMIWTLALFVLEPVDYIGAWSWRAMDPAEQHALFVVWRTIGAHMGIRECPPTLAALRQWQAAFLAAHTGPLAAGRALTQTAMAAFVHRLPGVAKPLVTNIVLHSLAPRERRVLSLPDPTPAWDRAVTRLLRARAWVVRHALLPRVWSAVELGASHKGRYQRSFWIYEPWYVAETWGSRALRALGLAAELTPGPAWKPEGYRLEELGPARYEQLGHDEVRLEARKIRGEAVEGMCPFGFGGKME